MGGLNIDPLTAVTDALFRRRLELLLTTVLSIGLVSGATALAWHAGSYLIPPVDLETLRPLFIKPYWSYLNPEPVERFAYLTAVAGTYPAVLLTVWIARGLVGQGLVPGWAQHVLLGGLSLSLFGFAVASDTFGFLLNGTPKIVGTPKTMTVLIVAVGLIAAALFVVTRFPGSRADCFLYKKTGGFTLIAIAALLLTSLAPRLRSADMILGDVHFEAVFYSVSQVMAGKTLLSELPAQYGLYAELLAPMWWFTGHSVFAFTAIMVALQVVAACCVIFTIRGIVRLDGIFVLCALSVLWVAGSLWASVLLSPAGHEYFQIWPIRFLFPALGTYLLFRILRMPFAIWHPMALGGFSGLALVWNLDSGVPMMGAFLAVLVTKVLFGSSRLEHLKGLGLFAVAAAAMLVIFYSYLSLKAGSAVQLNQWFKYQSIFYAAGFGMLPMTPWGGWITVYSLYIAGLAAGVYRAAIHASTVRSDVLIFLSVLGIGLFTYFQGRSHTVVLCFVCWPAIIIAFAFADELIRSAKVRTDSAFSWHASPILIIGLALSLAFVSSIPQVIIMTYRTAVEIMAYPDSLTRHTIDFIKSKTGRDEAAAIIAPGQGAYFAETRLASALAGPGIIEILRQEDHDQMVLSLQTSPVEHVFIRAAKAGGLPGQYQDLLKQYVVTDRFGPLLYLTPKRK